MDEAVSETNEAGRRVWAMTDFTTLSQVVAALKWEALVNVVSRS